MVVFPPVCPPRVLNAYSNIPLQANLTSTIQREFDIGAFARFPDPAVALTIHERPDLHNQSSLAIREILDREGQTGGFVLIDANVTKPGTNIRHGEPFNTAVWWVTSRAASERYTNLYDRGRYPPIRYPGEAFVLWRARLLTQDLPLQWVNWDVGTIDVADDIAQTLPYDPHDPQTEAYSLGRDFSNKTEAKSFYWGPYVQANYSEIEISQDMVQRRRFLPLPSCVVRLTQQAATEAGLLSRWTASYGDIPQPGDIIKLQQYWDWDSPKWAGNDTANLRFPRRRRSGGLETTQQSRSNATIDRQPEKFLQSCQRLEVVNIAPIVRELHNHRLPPPPLQSIAVS